MRPRTSRQTRHQDWPTPARCRRANAAGRAQEARLAHNDKGRPEAAPASKQQLNYLDWLSFCSIRARGTAPGTRSPSAKNRVGVPVML